VGTKDEKDLIDEFPETQAAAPDRWPAGGGKAQNLALRVPANSGRQGTDLRIELLGGNESRLLFLGSPQMVCVLFKRLNRNSGSRMPRQCRIHCGGGAALFASSVSI